MSGASAEEGAGTRINSRSLISSYDLHPQGMSLFKPTRRRSPAGFLYPFPFKPNAFTANESGLLSRGSIELGHISNAGNTKQAFWEEFVDRSPGILLNQFSVDLRHADHGGYAHVDGGSINRDDQYVRAEAGVFGWLRLKGMYQEIPHRLMNDAKTIFQGVGTEELRLPAGLSAGASTEAEIDALLDDLPFRSLAVKRERGSIGIEGRPFRILRLYGEYRHEDRQGERPFGGSLGFAFLAPTAGSVIETIEPIDYETHDYVIGAQLAHRWAQLNVSYSASYFDNGNQSLLWENPFIGFESDLGQSALAPDNQWHNLKGDLGFILPLAGRFTTSVSWGRARQDELLLAPTVNPLAPDWLDPATALGRPLADAEFSTLLSHTRLQFRPFRQLQLKAELRYFDRDSDTTYIAFNPALDFFGYLPEDGFFGPFFVVPRYKSVPYGYTKWNGKVGGVIRPGWRTTVELEYERETVKRDHRVRERTEEDRYRVSATNRSFSFMTLRFSYEYGDKRGSDIDVTRDFSFYSAGPPDFGLPAPFLSGTPLRSVAELRQFDLADRRQNVLTARANAAIGDWGDISASVRYFDDDYDARYGLNFDRGGDANVEIAFLPSTKFSATAFASFEARRRQIRGINGVGFRTPLSFLGPTTIDTFAPGDFAAGFPVFPPVFPPFILESTDAVFPLENEWRIDTSVNTWAFGLDAEATLWERLTVDLHYAFVRSNETRDYVIASDGALTPVLTADDVGSNFPTLKNADHVFEGSALYRLDDKWAARLFFRYQRSSIENFQQTGLTPRIGHILSLGHIDEKFSATIFGATIRYRF